jgi:hypothetical protein
MPNYQKGKIYKLWSPQGNEIYIGSTINPLSKRFNDHKTQLDCSSKYLFENYDVVKIELIEEFPCNNKMELNRREGEHIRNNECLNRCIAGRTKKEYKQDNKEKHDEWIRKWRKDNRIHVNEKCKEYYDNNPEKKKEYYENNKQKILEIHSQKFDCECGGKYTYGNKTNHFKTKQHIAFMNSHQ